MSTARLQSACFNKSKFSNKGFLFNYSNRKSLLEKIIEAKREEVSIIKIKETPWFDIFVLFVFILKILSHI